MQAEQKVGAGGKTILFGEKVVTRYVSQTLADGVELPDHLLQARRQGGCIRSEVARKPAIRVSKHLGLESDEHPPSSSQQVVEGSEPSAGRRPREVGAVSRPLRVSLLKQPPSEWAEGFPIDRVTSDPRKTAVTDVEAPVGHPRPPESALYLDESPVLVAPEPVSALVIWDIWVRIPVHRSQVPPDHRKLVEKSANALTLTEGTCKGHPRVPTATDDRDGQLLRWYPEFAASAVCQTLSEEPLRLPSGTENRGHGVGIDDAAKEVGRPALSLEGVHEERKMRPGVRSSQ
ncbi:MAG: hypothetical protein KJ698_13730 [Actinobacteria bacterium]|nr:hypothetical protein [Actinomycetota bacterium]